jgi:ASC-1-like (ASCH) protein
MQAERQVKVGHRVEFNPGEVKEALGIASEKLATYREMAEYLGSKRFSMDKLVEYYNTVYPRTSDKRVQDKKLSVETLSRNAKECLNVLETQPGAEFAEGSWWQAYNSVTYVTDHVQGRNADNRLYSSWFGSNQGRKKNALETAIEFAEAA